MTDQFVIETSNADAFPPCASFDDMGLSDELLRGIFAHGFEKPSAIQSVAIRPIVAGRDVLGQAQSGTGKTGAFGIGVLGRVDPTLKEPQAIVLAHTRELADQIYKEFCAFSAYMKLNICYAVGGVPRHQNVRDIRNGAQIIIGTPGRVFDLASSGTLRFAALRNFILDEADEMLRDRFADQVSEIVKIGLPDTCRIGFFSATMPPEVKELADSILRDPVRVTLREADVKLEGIEQYYVTVDDDFVKLEAFCDIYQALTIQSSIIFVNTKERAERLYNVLTERGFPVSVIYGEPMTQDIRQQRMREFRKGETRVLIATNLLARGIDVQQVSCVFNFDLPSFEDKENYIHRIGRCGRYGRKGAAISLLTPMEKDVLDQIATHYSFVAKPLPADLKGVASG
jgi:translation initiation factor 4A